MDGALLQAFVYLAAAAVSVPLAKRLGLGSVLGYLIAGAVIGPYALGLVGRSEDVLHAAEFGVVMLLFLIGLEVRPALLWTLRTVIFGVGLLQLVLTGLVLAGAGLGLGFGWREALAAGLILALSSTAIVLQLLDEQGLRRGPVGLNAFGVLLFQDLAVIPLLALLPLLAVAGVAAHGAGGEAHGPVSAMADAHPALQAAAILGAVAAVVIGGRYLIRPVFRFIAASKLREVFTVTALLIVIGVALLMQLVGLSPALGAFLAGVVLAESEFRRELESDIEPFRGLLLGLFFISVGANLDFGLIGERPGELVGLVVGLMALKGFTLFLIARAFRTPWRDAATAAVALSQGGEFAFVLLTFAVGASVLTEGLASLLTAVVALSMAATPLLLAAWLRLSRPRAEARDAPENDFDEKDPDAVVAGSGRFGQIVVRVLTSNGFNTSVLESSIEQIELLRRFGRRVYYGDAGRLDLLRAAGAEKARIFVCAIDDRDRALEVVETVKEAFPHLVVLARAFDRRHAYELLKRGAHVIERETFEGGLAMAGEALRALGWRAYRAERATRIFRRHDERLFFELQPMWGDEERYTVATRESSPRMEDLLRADLRRLSPDAPGDDWSTESLYRELREEPPKTAAE